MDKEIKIKVLPKVPVKGEDYFTPQEMAEFRSEIADTIPVPKDGRDGKDGIDGVDGIDGRDGKDGLNGKDGKNGIDGKDGRDGEDGKDGKDGVDGKDGEDGARGLKGEKGEKGDRGPAGKDGGGSASKDYALGDLTDVATATLSDGQVLAYDSASGTWINSTSAAGGTAWGDITGTLSDQTDLQAVLDTKIDNATAIAYAVAL